MVATTTPPVKGQASGAAKGTSSITKKPIHVKVREPYVGHTQSDCAPFRFVPFWHNGSSEVERRGLPRTRTWPICVCVVGNGNTLLYGFVSFMRHFELISIRMTAQLRRWRCACSRALVSAPLACSTRVRSSQYWPRKMSSLFDHGLRYRVVP